MSISLEGLMTMGGEETRALATVKVIHNDHEYVWQTFVPPESDLAQFILESEARIKSEIDAKEAEWTALTPKTREIEDPITGEITTVDIDKSEVVKAEIPDYFAKRRAEYPSLGDQLDALWKGGSEQTAMLQKIQSVKTKYPKA